MALMRAKATLATAESCTGGLIGHRVTSVTGVSACYLGGVVAYANEIKTSILGVDPDVIDRKGAVCEAVAAQMATGVRKRFGADYGIGVTGIAGPDGGTPGKPVGLVYVAVSDVSGAQVERRQFDGARSEIKEQAATCALEMLLDVLP